jgi:hypothetical protein
VNCTLCRDKPLPGYRCVRCGTRTPGEQPDPTEPQQTVQSRGKYGPALTSSTIRDALAGLADLTRRRQGKHEARRSRDEQYAEQLARHVQHPQGRGAHRRMLSKP